MLSYEAKHWNETANRRGDCRSLLFSAPDRFNMSRGSNRHLNVNSVNFPIIGTSLLSVASSGHEIDLADDKFLTVMLPTRGVTRVRMDRKEQIIGAGAALGRLVSTHLTLKIFLWRTRAARGYAELP